MRGLPLALSKDDSWRRRGQDMDEAGRPKVNTILGVPYHNYAIMVPKPYSNY